MAKILKRTKRAPGELSPSDLWRTPRDLFAALHREFGFHLDLAADAENHLLDRWLGPGGLAVDALAASWLEHGRRGFLNPPYSSAFIGPFLEKAAAEAQLGFTCVTLIPCTPDTAWWQAHVAAAAAEIREIPHRLVFIRADGVTRTQAMFSSAVVVLSATTRHRTRRPAPGGLDLSAHTSHPKGSSRMNDISAALAQLRAKRDLIDNAIRSLEAIGPVFEIAAPATAAAFGAAFEAAAPAGSMSAPVARRASRPTSSQGAATARPTPAPTRGIPRKDGNVRAALQEAGGSMAPGQLASRLRMTVPGLRKVLNRMQSEGQIQMTGSTHRRMVELR